MKIAIFGKSGQVATELQRRVPDGVTVEPIGRDRADFANPQSVYETMHALEADAVINAVAYTAVDRAEEQRDLAKTINGNSVGKLGVACRSMAIPLVHISTDYVFSGKGDVPWQPNDQVAPLGTYGASKLEGELSLADTGVKHGILRTSWVFSAHGNNFVKTMLRLGAERPELTVVDDQIGGPTSAASIADACYTLARALKDGHTGGTYHFSGAPDVSWADFAREIMAQAGLAAKITNVSTSDYPTPAQRPLNSRLDCTSLERDFGIKRPDWRRGLRDVLNELSP